MQRRCDYCHACIGNPAGRDQVTTVGVLAVLRGTGHGSDIAGSDNVDVLKVSACFGTQVEVNGLPVSRPHLLSYEFVPGTEDIVLRLQANCEKCLKVAYTTGIFEIPMKLAAFPW